MSTAGCGAYTSTCTVTIALTAVFDIWGCVGSQYLGCVWALCPYLIEFRPIAVLYHSVGLLGE